MTYRPLPLLFALVACGGNEVAPVGPPSPPPPDTVAAAPAATPAPLLPAWSRQYPRTRTGDVVDVLFGTQVKDPYRWLEDGKAPEVVDWMKAEDDLARKKLAALPERDAIAARLKELLYVDSQSTPHMKGGRLFYERRSGTQEKWVVYWRQGKKGTESVLLDPNTWSKDGSTSLRTWSVSWDGKRVAYGVSEHNSDEATMHVMDIDTGKASTIDVIPGAKYARASWTPRGDGFYYVRLPVDATIPTDKRPGYSELRFHKIGTDPAKDELVHEKTGDPTTFLQGWVSKDGRWLFSRSTAGRARERDLLPRSRRSRRRWTPLAAGRGRSSRWTSTRASFYVSTNDGAPKWRVLVVDPAHVERSAWKEIVPERSDATLDTVGVVGGRLSLLYLKDVATHLELHDRSGALVREIALPRSARRTSRARMTRTTPTIRSRRSTSRSRSTRRRSQREATRSGSSSEGAGRSDRVRRRAGVLPVEGRDADSLVRRPRRSPCRATGARPCS